MGVSLSISRLRKFIAVGFVALLCTGLARFTTITESWSSSYGSADQFQQWGWSIGALLPLSGDLATFGVNSKVAIEFAVKEVNELLREARRFPPISLLVEDTQLKPDMALKKLKYLTAMGIKFIVGPFSSNEVQAIKGYADANKILVVSHGSSALNLAIQDDYIFRFGPQDESQGRAIARLMYDKGKRYVIPVWLGNAWTDGLLGLVKTRFMELGGTFLDGMRYPPGETDFSEEALALNHTVTSAVAKYRADKVGVLYIGWNEVSAFFTAAKGYLILRTVKWYGSDGTVWNKDLINNVEVAEFCAATGFINTFFSPTRSDKYQKVHDKLVAELGREPDPYAYVAYDIVWALTYSLLLVNRYDSTAIRAVLPEVTESLFGASGWIVLNNAGDRAFGDYDLWVIVYEAGEYRWKLVGTYIYATDSISQQLEAEILGVYFSPKGGCEDQVIYWINRANKSIHVLIYSFTLDSVGDALINAYNRGIEVKVVFEEEQISRYSEYQRLKEAGISVRNDTNPHLMHDKVMIVDNIIVLTGSFNWSENAEENNNENLLIIKSVYIAEIYEEEYEGIWEESI